MDFTKTSLLSLLVDGKLKVRVTPKASLNKIKIEMTEEGEPLIRVYITTVPEDGKANKEVIKLLSKELKLPKSDFTITQGLKSRDKTITVKNL